MTTEEKIHHQLATNPIILYMKGIPSNPQCGFSGKAVNILNATRVPFSYVNVLEAPFIREKLPKISHWPTYPQLFVNAELIGGCDILEELSNNGSLLTILQSALPEKKTTHDESISKAEAEELVLIGIPNAKVIIEGAGCDLTVTVISEQFSDLSLVKKQQLVMATLKEPLGSGKLHALSVKAYTPEEWQALSENSTAGLLQIKI